MTVLLVFSLGTGGVARMGRYTGGLGIPMELSRPQCIIIVDRGSH
jgi:hypothetical protein